MLKKLIEPLAGNFSDSPQEVELTAKAQELLNTSISGFSNSELIDCHLHILGKGTGDTGCYANPDYFSWKHPVERTRMIGLMSSADVDDESRSDQEYVERLFKLIDDMPVKGKMMLLALDKAHDEDGSPNEELTKFYVPNEYIYEVCKQRPESCIPVMSVHPYRKDAISELEKWASKGVKMVKWLPNAMGMDPSHKKCIPFYRKMEELDLILLGHAGKETAIEVFKYRNLGNPLLYRTPLDMGVKVIIAHCAGLGTGKDLDAKIPIPIKNHKLFLRLMDEKQYEGLLFGDISALTNINRMGAPLKQILERTDIHHRLINGSDYPLPAVNMVMSTKAFVKLGYIDETEREALNQIYNRNPLLFDFVLKRTLKNPKTGGKFPDSVFKDHPQLKLTKFSFS
jgi:uncharacterized protein